MKELILFFIALGTVLGAQSQDLDSSVVFSHTQVIQNGGVTFVESEGYDVFQEYVSARFDKKGLKKVKRKYKIPKELEPTTSVDFPNAQIFRTHDEVDGEVVSQRTYYCYESGPLLIQVIGAASKTKTDDSIEEFLVKTMKLDAFPEYAESSLHVDSVKFADRYIQLGPACRWMGTHNLQCPNMGQMNWSEFSSRSRAEQMIANQRKVNDAKNLTSVQQVDSIKVIFEGQETQAIRNRTKIKVPKLVMGGSNVLIVYYVMCEVRGRYVACVLSHYTDDIGADELPPLLSEVMEFAE